MSEQVIKIESSAENLSVAKLMMQCDVKLKEVVVIHKMVADVGYFEMRIWNMFLNGTILSGSINLIYCGEKEDRFGRAISKDEVFVKKGDIKVKKRTLLQCLGINLCQTRKDESETKEIVPIEDAVSPSDKKSWEIDIESEALIYVNKSYEHNIDWNKVNIMNALKAKLLNNGELISNELLSAILDPMYKCLFDDWDNVLKF